MKSEQVIQRLSTTPEASIENLQEHRYWLQCERAYTYQPIYRTDGRLMAIEILTVVTHPSNPSQRIAPDRYFAEVERTGESVVEQREVYAGFQLHQQSGGGCRIAILPKWPFASVLTCWKSSSVCWQRSSPFSNSTISSLQ